MENDLSSPEIQSAKGTVWKCMIICLIGGTIAVIFYLNDHAILSAIAAFFTFVFAMAVSMMRQGTCPTCQKQMAGFLEVDCCPHCGAYAQIVNQQLLPISEGFISPIPRFKCSFNTLRYPSQWQWPWPGKCCVCKKTATLFETIEIRVLTGASGVIVTTIEKTVYTFKVGYCSHEHKTGVECEIMDEGSWPENESSDSEVALLFRSYDYWCEFKAFNSRST